MHNKLLALIDVAAALRSSLRSVDWLEANVDAYLVKLNELHSRSAVRNQTVLLLINLLNLQTVKKRH